jgi:hypothetical protein
VPGPTESENVGSEDAAGTGTVTYGSTGATFSYQITGETVCLPGTGTGIFAIGGMCAYLQGTGTDSSGLSVNVAGVVRGDLTGGCCGFQSWVEGTLAVGGADTTTLLQDINQELADAQCAASQVGSSPQSPGSGQTLCQTTKSVAQEADCIQSQISSPSSQGDPICQAAGVAVQTAKNLIPSSSTDESDTCTSPAVRTVFDGFAGSSYAKLVTDQPSSSEASVCFRVDQTATQELGGGRLNVGASGSVAAPSVDTNYSACSSTSGNTIPGSHPMFTNTTLGLTDMIDSYADSSGDVWLCLEAQPVVGSRVLLTQPSASPAPLVQPDGINVAAPPPTPGPTGYPSSNCQAGLPSGAPVQAVDANVGGVQTWLYALNQSSSGEVDLCVRAQPVSNPTQGAGGELAVKTNGAPGVSLVGPGTSNNASSCTQQIESVSAEGTTVTISSTPAGANPAYVCVTSSLLPQPVVVYGGFTGTPTVPAVTWSPDPGTPALALN